jgi:hypothetical protein
MTKQEIQARILGISNGSITIEIPNDIKQEIVRDKALQFFKNPKENGYYAEKAISASFLKNLKDLDNPPKFIFGDKQRNFDLGNVFEIYLLEEVPDFKKFPTLFVEDFALMHELAEIFLARFPEIKGIKSQYAYIKNVAGLRTKCKTDYEVNGVIYELKTTSAKSIFQYLGNHNSFDYDMQAWLQRELSGKEVFFKVISKTTKEIFEVEPDYDLGKSKFQNAMLLLEKYNLKKEFEILC